MGNTPINTKIKSIVHKTKTAYSAIGEVSYCPNCEAEFPPTTLYETFDQHVTSCLQNYQPSDDERRRNQRRKKSKGSFDSQQDTESMKIDEQTIEVYTRKWIFKKSISSISEHHNNNPQIHDNLAKSQKLRESIIKKHTLSYNPLTLKNLAFKDLINQSTPIKILWLQQKIFEYKVNWKYGCENLVFSPNTILTDSLLLLHLDPFKQLKLTVNKDIVHDAGGLLREWSSMLLKSFIKDTGIFYMNKEGYYSLSQYKSLKDIKHQYYELIGILMAKILIEKVTIPIKFDYTFLRILLGNKQSIKIQDFATVDRQLYQSYHYLNNIVEQIQENNKIIINLQNKKQQIDNIGQIIQEHRNIIRKSEEELQALSLTFSIIHKIGKANQNEISKQFDLVPNGRNITIKNTESLRLYLKLVMQFQAFQCFSLYQNESQMQIFQECVNYYPDHQENITEVISNSFNKIIKPHIFHTKQLFQPQQFELLINGLSEQEDISVDDWKAGTQYYQPYSSSHKTIKYFWNIVSKMNNKQKMGLLRFATGCECLPLYGFKNLQTNRGQTSFFIIQAMKYDKKKCAFPKAHTCFNRLVLPTYPNEQSLKQGIMAVVKDQFQGVWGIQ